MEMRVRIKTMDSKEFTLNAKVLEISIKDEILRIEKDSFSGIIINSTNDDKKMFLKPAAANEFRIVFKED